jgi:hypothetical protein
LIIVFRNDILYTSVTEERMVGIKNSSPRTYEPTPFSEFVMSSAESKSCLDIPTPYLPLSSPHSVAFLDLNTDCLSDLFITSADTTSSGCCPDGPQNCTGCIVFEVWIAQTKSDSPRFCLVSNNPVTYENNKKVLVDSIGQISFADLGISFNLILQDRDGSNDMAFAIRDKNDGEILYIFYNLLSPEKVTTWDDTILCNSVNLKKSKNIFPLPVIRKEELSHVYSYTYFFVLGYKQNSIGGYFQLHARRAEKITNWGF